MRLRPTTLHEKSKEHPRCMRFSLWRVSLFLSLLLSLGTGHWRLATALLAQQSQNFFLPSRGTWPTLNIGPGNANGGVTSNYVTGAHSGNLYFGGATLSGSAGSATLTAAGTNQNVTVTPSGTGFTILNGNVGIGTTSPATKLDVNGAVHVGSTTGIGTASPGARLHVLYGSGTGYTWTPTAGTVEILEDGTDARAFLTLVGKSTGQSEVWFADENSQNQGRVRYDHTTDSLSFWSNAASRMTIDNAGNVGIGTASPALQLDVAKAMRSHLVSQSGGGTSYTWSIDLSAGNIQQFKCTGNGTAVSVSFVPSSLAKGEMVTMIFVQTGSPNTACGVSWPTSSPFAVGHMAVSSTLSSINVQQFVVSNNGSDLYAVAAGSTGMSGGTP